MFYSAASREIIQEMILDYLPVPFRYLSHRTVIQVILIAVRSSVISVCSIKSL